ncbi:NAD(P)-dependent oxidoreductase [Lacisediminihabitans sp.]|uniref:NAD-dependent epimerase/dehydratase family protein n=1 Tax=Lacisediminihabitans sp. TaxID=2787631 RepID=UPI002F91E02C
MKVLVAGATGVIGRPLVRHLVRAGHAVAGLTRTEAGADQLAAQGARAIRADILDLGALLEATAGLSADAVINEVTALARPPARYADMESTNRLRTQGSAHLLALAKQAGATRFVTQSIVFGYGYRDHGAVPLTEDSPFGVPAGLGSDAAVAAMADAERQVFEATGIDGIAVRYGLLYGGDPEFVPRLRSRSLPVASGRRGTIALVHAEDAALGTIAALERGVDGAAYNIVDDTPATWREFIEESARTAGAPRPSVLPGWALRLVAPYAAELLTRVNLRVSNERACDQLGWAPRYPSFREGLAVQLA